MKILFEIELKHSYFNDGTAGGTLKVVPTKDTALHLQRLGLSYKIGSNGIKVIYPENRAEGYLYYLGLDTAHTMLCFQLLPLDRQFYNYTQLDFPGTGYLLSYESRQERNGDLIATGLEKGGFAKFASQVVLENGQQLVSPAGANLPAGPNDTVDLSLHGEGVYTIAHADGVENRMAWFDLGMQQMPLGLIGIDMADEAIKTVLTKASNNEAQPGKGYIISFEARKTIWQYHLNADDASRDLSQYSVVGDENITFTRLPNHNEVVFESSEPVFMQERYMHSFSLRNGNAGKALIERLPGATADIILPDMSGKSSKVYSEIHVYI